MSKLANIIACILNGVDKVNNSLGWAGMGLLIALLGVMNYEVFRRFVLRSPTPYSLEMCQIIQVFLPMLAVGWLLGKEEHVMVEVLLERLNPRLRNWVICITSAILGFTYCGLMVWLGGLEAYSATIMNERTHSLGPGRVGYPLYPVRWMICVGFCLLALQFVVRSYKHYQLAKAEAKDSKRNG